MKTKYLISFIALSFLIISSTTLIGQTFAQKTVETANIQYPVEELGNCKDETACRSYCDKPENREVCFDFAQKNNLMSEEEVNAAKNFLAIDENGPGGCKGKEECEKYCSNTNHIDECIAFAEENNLIPPEELEEAKKVQAAIKRGFKPPPCGDKKQCDIYCDNPDHMEECITFGIEAGFIQGKELEDVQKMLAAVKRGVKPPPCKGKEACDKYCGEPDNMEVCMTFALEAGFMTEQEKADSQKMLEALKKGIKPPNCRGKEECDVYCGQEEHFEECMNFAEAAGFMSPEDAAMARKTGGKGPGGCRGKEECDVFCNNPDNQEICFNFAKEHGLIPEEDLKMMEEGKQKFQESLNQAPPEVMDCLISMFGSEMMEKFKSGSVMPNREIGDQMRQCFEKMGPMMGPPPDAGAPGEGGIMPPAGQTGPGGCKTPEECQAYCEANPDECKGFQPPAAPGGPIGPEGQVPGGPPPGEIQPGPGGCKSAKECQDYCSSHPEECKGFQQPQIPGGPEGLAPGTEGFQPPTGTTCQTPEECQKMMPPPTTCEGEGCQVGPGQIQPDEQAPPNTQMPPVGQQPPSEQQPPPPPPEGPPPPTESFTPGSLLQTIIRFFTGIFQR